MTNAEVAAAFSAIAEILALQGENPFRINAYARAAITIAALPRSLKDLYGEEGIAGLTELPGIGRDLSAKIEELVTTDKLVFLEKLKKQVPPGLLQIAEIPGMGPKKTSFVWKKFKVRSIADLEKLIRSGKLARVKGWGEKSVQNALHGIEIRRVATLRTALPAVLPLAEEMTAALRRTKLCDRIEIAGSLRRRCETIGDIDILVTSDHPEQVMEAFTSLPWVQEVTARGGTRSAVRLKSGMACDLRVVEPGVFGAALHYFTGSKAHNVHLRTIAVKRGMTISEYGVFRGTAEKKGRMLAAATEEQVFAACGLPFIPPEMREDRGEIEAAQRGRLPVLIEERDLTADLHLHSDFSDGSSSMIDMAKAAKARGFQYIAITDHGSSMGMVKGLKTANLREYLARIDEVRSAVKGITILAGVEVDIEANGSLYLPDVVLGKLDWVVAAIHSRFSQSRAEATERMLRAIANPHVRVLAHPTARLLGKRPPIEFDAERVLREAAKRGVALELNASIYRLDLNDVHCQLAKNVGAKIALDSDAHNPSEFEYSYGIAQARRGWLEKGNVINTLPWKQFEKRVLKR